MYFSIKNKASEKVSLAAMMIYPRITGAGRNVQNVIFLNRRLKKGKRKLKRKVATTKDNINSTPDFELASPSCMKNQAHFFKLFILAHAFRTLACL